MWMMPLHQKSDYDDYEGCSNLRNSADPDEMQQHTDFIWVITVSQITHLRVSRA